MERPTPAELRAYVDRERDRIIGTKVPDDAYYIYGGISMPSNGIGVTIRSLDAVEGGYMGPHLFVNNHLFVLWPGITGDGGPARQSSETPDTGEHPGVELVAIVERRELGK